MLFLWSSLIMMVKQNYMKSRAAKRGRRNGLNLLEGKCDLWPVTRFIQNQTFAHFFKYNKNRKAIFSFFVQLYIAIEARSICKKLGKSFCLHIFLDS